MNAKVNLMIDDVLDEATGIRFCLDAMLLGLRVMGCGIQILNMDHENFMFRVKHDPEVRLEVETLHKMLVAQLDFDEHIAGVTSRACDMMLAALSECDGWTLDAAFERPIDSERIPLLDEIDIDYVNALHPDTIGFVPQ